MNWIHRRDFELMGKTLDSNLTPVALIADLTSKMVADPIFDDFIHASIEGDWFVHFEEDTRYWSVDEQIEKADELLGCLYDYADSERIALS